MPAVSVVIPAYNRQRFACEAVASVLAQTFQDLEVIVVDDGSTDGTADALARAFGDRIHVERLPRNQGRSTARNVGWEIARGEFVAFLDSDDLWLPGKLARQMPAFARSSVVMSHTWVGKIDSEGKPLPKDSDILHREFARATSRGYDYGGITETWCRMYTSAVVLRRGILHAIGGGFHPDLWNFEDWDVLWRAARAGEVATVPETLVLHRTHPDNTPMVWAESAVQWISVIRRHLAEAEAHAGTPGMRRARRNLLLNMSLGEYWRRDLSASRRWMWRALWADPGLLLHPGYYVWAAPLMHALLPHSLADRVVVRYGMDNYPTVRPPQ